jgi:hypothetical protein
MDRRQLAVVAMGVLLAAGWARPSSAQDAETLYRRAVQGLLCTRFEAKGSLQGPKGESGEFVLRRSCADGTMRTWIEVQKPAELRGQRFLIWNRIDGKNQGWSFDPKTKQTQEFDAAAWRKPFLKSDFLLGDFLFPAPAEHKFEVGGEENYGGQTFTVIHLYAKDAAAALYPHRVYSIDPRQNLLLRAMYFDAQDKPSKRWIAERIERRGSEWFPTEQKVLSLGSNPPPSTSLRLTDLRYEPELPPDSFEPGGLSKSAQK